MYCTQCGQKAIDGAKFCTECGNPLGVAAPGNVRPSSPGQRIISVAVHLKTGFIKREPWVLWISPPKIALICVGEKRYENITSTGSKVPGYLPKAKAMAEAFSGYAQSLTKDPLEEVLKTHPGSVVINTAQIRELQIIATYDEDLRRYDDYERFIMETSAGKYRGAFERDTELSAVNSTFEVLLGSRYRYRTIGGFPFL